MLQNQGAWDQNPANFSEEAVDYLRIYILLLLKQPLYAIERLRLLYLNERAPIYGVYLNSFLLFQLIWYMLRISTTDFVLCVDLCRLIGKLRFWSFFPFLSSLFSFIQAFPMRISDGSRCVYHKSIKSATFSWTLLDLSTAVVAVPGVPSWKDGPRLYRSRPYTPHRHWHPVPASVAHIRKTVRYHW